MIYGYARVSTKGQAKDGNSLESQEKAFKEHGVERIFKDSFTGTKKHRPEFDKLMSQITSGDTLIVTKLDRIARSTIQGCELVNELLDRGVTVNVLNIHVHDFARGSYQGYRRACGLLHGSGGMGIHR